MKDLQREILSHVASGQITASEGAARLEALEVTAAKPEVRAGDVRIEGVHGPISGSVQAGNCVVRDFRAPLDLAVQAGELTAIGRLDSGSSKLRCQMGEMNITLQKGSSVRIKARAHLGDVRIDGELRDKF